MPRGAALALGLSLAGAVLGGAELYCRHNERDIDYAWDQPGRRYRGVPGLYDANGAGFHEREVGSKRPGVKRVAVVGDSVTWGFRLSLEETLTRVAEADLGEGWEVLNYAMSGYDVSQVAATVRDVVRAQEPDYIVYAAYTNDVVPTRVIYVGADHAPIWVGEDRWPLHRASALVRRVEGAWRVRGLVEAPDYAAFDAGVTALKAAAGPVPLAAVVLLPHVLANPDVTACSAEVGEPRWCETQLDVADAMALSLASAHVPVRGTLGDLRATGRLAFYPPASPRDRNHPDAGGARVFGLALADTIRHLAGLPDSVRPVVFPG